MQRLLALPRPTDRLIKEDLAACIDSNKKGSAEDGELLKGNEPDSAQTDSETARYGTEEGAHACDRAESGIKLYQLNNQLQAIDQITLSHPHNAVIVAAPL